MKNKFKFWIACLLSSSILIACGGPDQRVVDPGQSTSSTEESSSAETANEVSVRQEPVTVGGGIAYYRPILDENNNYVVSRNRGITTELNSSVNISIFEEDLTRLSQDYFPVNEHYFQEGQYLPENLVSTWLGRQTENNPSGLNPAPSAEGEARKPNYLASIIEFDFYSENEEGAIQLSGMSLGLAINSVDYYPAYQYGPILQQEIDRETLIAEGQRMADEIISRIRQNDELSDIPIFVGLYEQAPQDDLAGGVYIQTGLSQGGSTSVSSWQNLNESRLIFPLEGDTTAEGNAFANFQSEVESFFPNISGLSARAHYKDDLLKSLEIDVTPHFYSHAELIAFVQYINRAANTFLPDNIRIEITIESVNGVEAFLVKHADADGFAAHIFKN